MDSSVNIRGGATSAVAAKEATLADHIASLDRYINAAQEIYSRLSQMADKIGGASPSIAGNSKEEPDGGPLNFQFRRKLDRLGQMQSLANGELNRLDGMI